MKDSNIKEKIQQYFSLQNRADLRQIQVTVNQGEVLLEGIVANNHDKKVAENLVRQMWEVSGVKSKLKLLSEATTVELPPLNSILQTA